MPLTDSERRDVAKALGGAIDLVREASQAVRKSDLPLTDAMRLIVDARAIEDQAMRLLIEGIID